MCARKYLKIVVNFDLHMFNTIKVLHSNKKATTSRCFSFIIITLYFLL